MNFKQETLEALDDVYVHPEEVLWCMIGHRECSWKDFIEAADFEYDDENGQADIDPSIKIVGADWYMYRVLSEPYEMWQISRPPARPSRKFKPTQKDMRTV